MAYQRKTEDEFEIQGLYNGKWEMVTTETTRKIAKKCKRTYEENERGTTFRIVTKRVPFEAIY